jgi:hypothetical protein
VGGESTWTIDQELESELMFSNKLLRPSFDEKMFNTHVCIMHYTTYKHI